MKIVVLAGGLSDVTERLPLFLAPLITEALRRKGHRVALVDLYGFGRL